MKTNILNIATIQFGIKVTLWLVSARDLDGLIPAVNVAGVALWADVWLKLLKRAVKSSLVAGGMKEVLDVGSYKFPSRVIEKTHPLLG